jgi:hypothetical protein
MSNSVCYNEQHGDDCGAVAAGPAMTGNDSDDDAPKPRR